LDGASIRAAARAKINLYLQVTGRRANGYHELDSLVAFADFGDSVEAAPAEDMSLVIEGPFAAGLSNGADNLVLRAATVFRDALAAKGVKVGGARLRLTKNLPVASGIGGGSADAAAALRALRTLWKIPPGLVDLAALGLGLGADLPVCLAGGPRFVGGIGERLDAVPELPAAWLLLVNPGVAVPTPAVFAARQGSFSLPARWSDATPDLTSFVRRLMGCRNDLTAPARSIAPVIGEVLDAIEALPGVRLARLSGSGATCFGIFATAADAETGRAAIARRHLAWWNAVAPMLTADAEPPLR